MNDGALLCIKGFIASADSFSDFFFFFLHKYYNNIWNQPRITIRILNIIQKRGRGGGGGGGRVGGKVPKTDAEFPL